MQVPSFLITLMCKQQVHIEVFVIKQKSIKVFLVKTAACAGELVGKKAVSVHCGSPAEGWAGRSVVEHLPHMQEALSSIASTSGKIATQLVVPDICKSNPGFWPHLRHVEKKYSHLLHSYGFSCELGKKILQMIMQ